MGTYHKKVRARAILAGLAAIICVAALLLERFAGLAFQAEPFVHGLLYGALTGGALVFAVLSLRYHLALRDADKLRQMEIRENDERLAYIRRQAGLPMLLFTSVGIIFAAIFVGFFSREGFYALLIAGHAQLVIALVAKGIATLKTTA